MYVYIRLGHFAVGQKLTEHCKSTKKKKKEKETRNKSDAIIKKKNLKDFKVKRIQNDSQIGIALQCPGFFFITITQNRVDWEFSGGLALSLLWLRL